MLSILAPVLSFVLASTPLDLGPAGGGCGGTGSGGHLAPSDGGGGSGCGTGCLQSPPGGGRTGSGNNSSARPSLL